MGQESEKQYEIPMKNRTNLMCKLKVAGQLQGALDWEEARGVPSFQGCQVVLFLDTLHSKVRNWSSVQGKVVKIEGSHPLEKYSLAHKKRTVQPGGC